MPLSDTFHPVPGDDVINDKCFMFERALASFGCCDPFSESVVSNRVTDLDSVFPGDEFVVLKKSRMQRQTGVSVVPRAALPGGSSRL
jgi:hypothetical protein